MGNTQLPIHQRLSFVDPPKQDPTEKERPDAIVDLLKADAMLLQCSRQVEQPGLEPDGTGVGDTLHEKVDGILERGERARIGARRGAVERAGRPSVQKLVGPFVVVLLAKPVERALLEWEGRTGWPDR